MQINKLTPLILKNLSSNPTALYSAAKRGDKEVVRLLVKRDDVKADLKDEYGWTPLW